MRLSASPKVLFIAGQREPVALAEMAKSRLRSKIPQLQEALSGHFGAHPRHRVPTDHRSRRLLGPLHRGVTKEITTRLVPFEAAVAIVTSVPGIWRTTAETIVAETRADMSRFPTPGRLSALAGVAPASHESAGKRRPAGTRHGAQWLRRALIEAAKAAARTKGTYYNAQSVRLARRRGPNRATVAVANAMLFTIWHLLTNDALYEDLGPDYFVRHHDPAVEAKRLARRIEALGFDVDLTQRAA